MRIFGSCKRVNWIPTILALACAEQPPLSSDGWALPEWPSVELAPETSLPPPGPLTLDVSPLSPGQQGTWTAGGLYVGEKVTFLVSPVGLGQGPCHPQGAPCVDLRLPVRVLGVAYADATGTATFTTRVPAAAPLGLRPAFQAVTVRNDGATANAKSPPIATRLQDACASFTCSPGACGMSVAGTATCFCPPGYSAQGTVCLSDDSAIDTDAGLAGDASPENPFLVDPNYEASAGQGGGTAARAPYGTNVGSYQGVASYSNAVLTCPSQPACLFGVGDGRTTGTYGYEYQCVEYVVRFFATVHGYQNLNGNGDAATWWNAPRLAAGRALERYANGGTVAPQPGDAIVFGGGTYGHIAVIRSVDATSVHIIHQNWLHSAADSDLPLPLTRNGSAWTVGPPSSGYTTLGWLRVPGATPAPICGDGVVNQANEECDGSAYAPTHDACSDRNFNQGTVSCTPGCTVDFSNCSNAPVCGDGVVNQPSEQCDGSNFAAAYNSCSDFGFSQGQVTCSGNCITNTTGCSNPPIQTCGNGTIDPGEECDGTNLGGATCSSLGYDMGNLSCSSCQYRQGSCYELDVSPAVGTKTPSFTEQTNCTCSSQDTDCSTIYRGKITRLSGNTFDATFEKASGTGASTNLITEIQTPGVLFPDCRNIENVYARRMAGPTWPSQATSHTITGIPVWPQVNDLAAANCGDQKMLSLATDGAGAPGVLKWYQKQAFVFTKRCLP